LSLADSRLADFKPRGWRFYCRRHLSPPKRARGNPAEPAKDLDTAKAEFKATWEALKARTAPEQLAVACKAMNIRGDG